MNKACFISLVACLSGGSLPASKNSKALTSQFKPSPIRHDSIYIARYENDKVCAISYTFDDGLREHYTVVTPRLNQLGFKGTFVINGSKINSNNNLNDTTRMSWNELKEMAAFGHEISNHGWAHKNLGKFPIEVIKEDILKNDSAIFANIGIMPRTFAYPNNTKTPEGVAFASLNRVGTRTFQRSLGGHSNTAELEKWVANLIAKKEWGVTMTHGITYGYDYMQNPGILWEHLKMVKSLEDKIWVGTFRQVSSYLKERDSTKLQLTKQSKGHYLIEVSCKLDPKLFQEPLTAVVDIDGADKATVWQGRKKLKADISSRKLVFNFDPFGEEIKIVPGNIPKL